jgi:hypothetical protein
MAVHLTRSVVCEGFSEVLYVQLQWMGLMMICCGIGVEDGNVRSEREENEDIDCEQSP